MSRTTCETGRMKPASETGSGAINSRAGAAFQPVNDLNNVFHSPQVAE